MKKTIFAVLLIAVAACFVVFSKQNAAANNKTSLASSSVVISGFQVAGGTATDEFIELHNVSNTAIDLNGHRLVYRSAAGTGDLNFVVWTTGTVIPAGGYFLVVSSTLR